MAAAGIAVEDAQDRAGAALGADGVREHGGEFGGRENDRWQPLKYAGRLAGAIPHADLVTVLGPATSSWRTRVADEIRAFLAATR